MKDYLKSYLNSKSKVFTYDDLNKYIAVALGARVKRNKIVGYECPPNEVLPNGGYLALDYPQDIPDYISKLRELESKESS